MTSLVLKAKTPSRMESLFGRLQAVMARLELWLNKRQQRRVLGQLDAHLRADIGLTRQQIEREISKPFWR